MKGRGSGIGAANAMVTGDDFARTKEALGREAERGDALRGAQAHVAVRGDTVLNVALGAGGVDAAMSVDTVLKVYCAIKPVTALAIAKLVERGALSLDRPLSKLLPSVGVLAPGDITLRHLLNHTAGLTLPSAVQMEVMPPDRRERFVDGLRRTPGWRVGRDAGYSEYFSWHLLGRLIELVTGEPLRAHLRTSVLDPLEMSSTFIGMTAEEYEANHQRVGINHDLRGGRAMPILLERARRTCCDVNCAYGGYTTASDLGRLYRAVIAGLAGTGPPALPSRSILAQMTSPARDRAFDVVLGRPCTYGLGFMTSLSEHEFGPTCSTASFGHSGWLGASFAFADPAHALVVAVVVNGISESEASFRCRQGIVRAIYDDLGIAPDVSSVHGPPHGPARRPIRVVVRLPPRP